jgi:choline dehydrogenase
MPEKIKADYIVVGAGSAGCVLANRLSADGRSRVLVIEAGPDDRPLSDLKHAFANLLIHIPAGFTHSMKSARVNWLYNSHVGAGERQHFWPRGKVLGGSSSINGMIYLRGQAADYDAWRQLGCEGWAWQDVLPLFMRGENYEPGCGEFHGAGGGLNISRPELANKVSEATLAACQQAGLAFMEDPNSGSNEEGVGWVPTSIKDGRRCSAAVAFLHPAMRRKNLVVETKALATRILFEGRRAIGIEYLQHGVLRQAEAAGELILAGGSVNSPQLLELSGIGRGDVLNAAGVPVLHELRGVGENLQDHYMVPSTFRLRPGTPSLNNAAQGLGLLREIAKYLTSRSGLLANAPTHVAAFIRSHPGLDLPDLQMSALPASQDYLTGALDQLPGLTIGTGLQRPQSRGSIHITSPNAQDQPAIRPNYLSSLYDQAATVLGIRWSRKIARQEALSKLIEHEILPGSDRQSDSELLQFANDHGMTIYHPVGTCAMGIGSDAVVDAKLKVNGVEGLRVADASIMPRIVSANTNAAAMMIGEKASDLAIAARAA